MKVFTALLVEISVKMLIYYQKRKKRKFQLKVDILLLFVVLRWKFSRDAYFLSGNILRNRSIVNKPNAASLYLSKVL